jgi:hypothetical protein
MNYNQMSDRKHIHTDPDLTDQEIERLCLEQASLRRRDEAIIAQLRRAIKDRREETTDIIKEHRIAMRQRRKAEREEHEQEQKEKRAAILGKLNPETLAKLKASIAEVRESTPEELKADRVAEIAQRKIRDPHRKVNGSGDQQIT